MTTDSLTQPQVNNFVSDLYLAYCICSDWDIDNKELITEKAEELWSTIYDLKDTTDNPFELAEYQAGVYCGAYNEDGSDAYAVTPDLSNLPDLLPHTDLWQVLENMVSPDSHADRAEEHIDAFIDSVYYNTDKYPTAESLYPALLEYMKVNASEYTVVLRAWNSSATDVAFWAFWAESITDTFTSKYDNTLRH